jgi:hypothetical protein
MTLATAPIFQVPDANITIELLAMDLQMLREFPDHQQADGWRLNIQTARRDIPEFLAMAELMISQEFAERDELREHPESCPRCHGSGYGPGWGGSLITFKMFCSCPLGEAMQRGRSLEQDSYDRGTTRQEPLPDGQLFLALEGVGPARRT